MTVRSVRIASLLALAVFAATATTSSAAPSGPTGLHGFLLRADEPGTTSFRRTPSFAWNPVPGARTYQFQLSTSSTFRDNGILYHDSTLTSPVSAPTLTLPWITGSPHALYARVRADLGADITPWSAPFGFDVVPPPPPSPLPSYAGVLRWTPTEGADGYQVWLIDTGKTEFVRTNVLDEREFYTFHQGQSWTGTVRWRIRAVRGDQFKQRVNGLPVAQTGAWSPIYSSTNNPPVPAVANGPITLLGTVSDVFSNGSPNSPAHEMMPAFLWSGNQTLYGTAAELYRVEIFTDKQCLNRVYTGAVVGSPAWAPRLNGPLALPQDPGGITAARSGYLGDGKETSSFTYDGQKLTPAEQQDQAVPTTSVPGDIPAFPGTAAPGGSTDPSAGASSGASGQGIAVQGNLGPPVSLWDVDWPQSGYYWTVVPVDAAGASGAGTTVAPPGVAKGATTIPVLNTTGFRIGDSISIGVAPNSDSGVIASIGSGAITLAAAVTLGHPIGDLVVRAGGSVQYVDAELSQDVCAAGRVQRLGISSEPSLTSAQTPFATGLSSDGRLTSAAHTSKFYGQPLIAWTPAFNADIYEVQYSKTAYPFRPEIDPRSKVKGFMTFSTSDVLPLSAGTWWYRVRGIDYNLPTGVQQMSWSDPEKLVVAPPKFKLVAVAVKKKKFKVVPPAQIARTTLIFKLKPTGVQAIVDYESPPAGRSKGDRVVLTDQLLNVGAQFGKAAGAAVGSDSFNLTFTSAEVANVQGKANLPGGTISFSGRWSLASATLSLTVTGGTGTFAQAQGTFTQNQDNSPIDTYTLSVLAP
jgi:hypothetical protein